MYIFRLLITFVVFSVAGLPSCFSADKLYEECLLPLICGSGRQVFVNTTYPFWGFNKPKHCGQSSFELSCEGNRTLTIAIGDLTLRVVSANLEDQAITVADESWLHGGCPEILNFTGKDQFTLNSNTETIDVFNCSTAGQPHSLSSINCKIGYETSRTYHVLRSSDSGPNCNKVGEIAMLKSAKADLQREILTLGDALKRGFDLRYRIEDRTCKGCYSSGGICGSEPGSENFRCLCEDRPHNSSCNDNQG